MSLAVLSPRALAAAVTLTGGAVTLVAIALSAQTPPTPVFLSYAQAAPVFAALGETAPVAADWPRWIAAADSATRARVARGDETSIVNLLLFGTSFTRQPRITTAQLSQENVRKALDARIDDFERALAQPGNNERLQYARRVLGKEEGRRARVLEMIDRTIKEGETLARMTAETQRLGDPSLEFAERSRLYRARGLASDTSLRINFAIEEALKGYTAAHGLTRVHRVAVIGPGLDVADKQEGHDFYPPQTIQPVAIMDSLVRIGLADAGSLRVTTFDVSARVNDHIDDIGRRARAGTPYVIHAPLDGEVAWTAELLEYFGRFGAAVGNAVPVTIPAGVGNVRLRAVSVGPSVVARISASNLNVTAQLLPLDEAGQFDLVIGTNVFLYYDRLEQGLAMASVAAMLRPGGLLLSNNALVEVPSSRMRSIGYSKTLYSNREEDGDVIIWYRKEIR